MDIGQETEWSEKQINSEKVMIIHKESRGEVEKYYSLYC
jgi:hypothetical protein